MTDGRVHEYDDGSSQDAKDRGRPADVGRRKIVDEERGPREKNHR